MISVILLRCLSSSNSPLLLLHFGYLSLSLSLSIEVTVIHLLSIQTNQKFIQIYLYRLPLFFSFILHCFIVFTEVPISSMPCRELSVFYESRCVDRQIDSQAGISMAILLWSSINRLAAGGPSFHFSSALSSRGTPTCSTVKLALTDPCNAASMISLFRRYPYWNWHELVK